MKPVNRLLVIGAGTMGTGIAQVAASAGCQVWLYDQKPEAASLAKQRIASSMQRAAEKGRLPAEQIAPALERLRPVASLDEVGDVQAIIEAVIEDREAKHHLFAMLKDRHPHDTAFWTNTSMIPISQIAQGLRHPRRVVGTHFFNPVPRMKLVEIIAGQETDPAVVAQAQATMQAWGKATVLAPDTPSFIVNRVFDAIKRVALRLLEEGTPADQIDTAIKLGLNSPMGPFEVMDLVGLDTTYRCLQTQAAAMSQPADVGTRLPQLIEQRKLGRKTGQGFYQY